MPTVLCLSDVTQTQPCFIYNEWVMAPVILIFTMTEVLAEFTLYLTLARHMILSIRRLSVGGKKRQLCKITLLKLELG